MKIYFQKKKNKRKLGEKERIMKKRVKFNLNYSCIKKGKEEGGKFETNLNEVKFILELIFFFF